MAVIRVVNRRTAGPVPTGVIRIYIGRPSPLGNPFAITASRSRSTVIAMYESWLRQNRSQPGVATALEQIRQLEAAGSQIELECWCAPQPCHADVIAADVIAAVVNALVLDGEKEAVS